MTAYLFNDRAICVGKTVVPFTTVVIVFQGVAYVKGSPYPDRFYKVEILYLHEEPSRVTEEELERL